MLSAEVIITALDFDKAVNEVAAEMIASEEFSGDTKILMPLLGMMFSSKIKDKLFVDPSKEHIKNVKLS